MSAPGQLLFTIDPRPAAGAARPGRARSSPGREAGLANARTELARSRTLAAAARRQPEEVETRQAAVRAGQADVAAARREVRARSSTSASPASLAPISGRISERRVDPGNAVTADQTVLTTIVSVDPLHFAFQGSEALLLKYQRQKAASGSAAPVRIQLQDEANMSMRAGSISSTMRSNAGAGTIRARAVVPNPTAS